jgi:amidase
MTELWKLSAAKMAQMVRNREVSAVELTEAHLARLAAVNTRLNAVVHEMPEEALQCAKAVDERVARGKDPGPLCGAPITTKVTTDQKGQATTGGLTLNRLAISASDSPIVTNIRKAGGIIIGRTATPAFSVRWFTNSILYGQTLNPHDPSLTPGGSSGGASASVAAGICAIGQGTDIAGSVRYPAYACGLQGLRPTFGRFPQFNAGAERPFGNQIMAVSGPIARSVRDIELSFQAMAAPDMRDPWFVPVSLKGSTYPRRVALTLAPDSMPVVPEVRKALNKAAHHLSEAGWEVEEIACPPLREAAEINAQLWMADVRLGLEPAIRSEGDPDASFVIKQMKRLSPALSSDDYLKMLERRATLLRDWSVFFETYPVLLCPSSGQLPFRQQMDVESEAVFEEVYEAQMTQRAFPALGLPGLSVATGFAGRAPVGVQLVAGRFREDILFAAGKDIERASPIITSVDPV